MDLNFSRTSVTTPYTFTLVLPWCVRYRLCLYVVICIDETSSEKAEQPSATVSLVISCCCPEFLSWNTYRDSMDNTVKESCP